MRTALFFVLSAMATFIYVMQQIGLPLPRLVNNYVNDFLCMPIVLFICQFIVRKIKSSNTIIIPLPVILLITAYFSFYFEYYLPNFNFRYTGDFIDVILYFLGAAFFYWTQNSSLRTNSSDTPKNEL